MGALLSGMKSLTYLKPQKSLTYLGSLILSGGGAFGFEEHRALWGCFGEGSSKSGEEMADPRPGGEEGAVRLAE